MQTKYIEDWISQELQKVINDIGNFPTAIQMGTKLSSAISRSKKPFSYYANKLGYQTTTKPHGYWQNWDNLKQELDKLIINNNFPTLSIIQDNIPSAVVSIYETFGGLDKVAHKMGYKLSGMILATDGHYLNSMNELLFDEYLYSRGIQHEANGLIHKDHLKRFDFKINDIYFEIWGYQTNSKTSRSIRYNQRRKNKEKLYQELNLQLVSLEHDLFKKPFAQIEIAFDNIMKSLDFDITKKDIKYKIENSVNGCCFWSEEKIIDELKNNIIPKYKTVLSKNALVQIGRGDLSDAIGRFGGFAKFRQLLGYELDRKPDGYWTEESIIEELKSYIENNKDFPTFEQLIDNDRHDLVRAINRNGGSEHFRDIFNMPRNLNKPYKWTKDKTIATIKELEVKLGRFPKIEDLHNEGLGGLESAITRQFGEFFNIKLELGAELTKREATILKNNKDRKPHYYWTEDKVKDELQKIINETGFFPSARYLAKNNRADLVAAMYKFGDIEKFKAHFNAPQRPLARKWPLDQMITKIKEVIDKVGEDKALSYIINNEGGLYTRLKRNYGGYKKFLQEHYIPSCSPSANS